MKRLSTKVMRAIFIFAALAAFTLDAAAQKYPEKTVRIVTPSAGSA